MSGIIRGRRVLLLASAAAVAIAAGRGVRAQDRPPETTASSTLLPRLAPTAHPLLPSHPSLYWLVPDLSRSASTAIRRADETPAMRFARGAKLIAAGEFAAGLPLVSVNLDATPLADYAEYYTGVALLGLGRVAEADAALAIAAKRKPEGYLREAVPVQLSDAAMARNNPKRAVDLLEDLSDDKVTAPEDVLLRLGHAAESAGDAEKALRAYRRVYYEFPLGTPASEAQAGIERLETPSRIPPDRFTLELKRAERLFTAKRWAQARAGFVPLARVALGDDKELIALRLGECDYYLDRARAAHDEVAPFIKKSSREAEARFFYLSATRALGDRDTYVSLARDLVADFPNSSWSAETLDNLASYYIAANQDEEADKVFRELARRFPQSRYAERAAWKSGWAAYRSGRFVEAAEVFESEAAALPRADTRPAWLYWSGRARDQLGDTVTANARYRLEVTDYLNTYYGRLASKLLSERQEPPVQESVRAAAPAASGTFLVPTDALVRQLIALELYDDALKELQYAQRVWGDSSPVQATVAWIRHQQGLEQKGWDRFQSLRGSMNLMKRAYPQFLAAGGEDLPPEVFRVMFPLDYWPLIKKYSDAYDLDPYLMAALMAQESTFTADIRSSANAYGLMQIIPATGRRYARTLGIPFSLTELAKPEINVRIGMTYFRDLIKRFGGAHYALASYNAGESRIARWISERPGIAQDEFIDDIPFPETQNYVKRILGTAEDYRRLYGEEGLLSPETPAPTVSTKPSPAEPVRKPAARPAAKPRAKKAAPATPPARAPRRSPSP